MSKPLFGEVHPRDVLVVDLLTSGECSPQCLLALMPDDGGCQCACGGEFHGVLTGASTGDVEKAELYDRTQTGTPPLDICSR
jgi:hypothetical protein